MEIEQGQSSVISEDVISDLLRRPFSIRNPTEQKAIVRMQQPRPKLQLMTRGRKFQQSWYTKKDWLCASETRKSLFCWPCLLFNSKSGRSTWTHAGYVNMHGFLSDCQKHERSKSHMESYKMWKTFDNDRQESVDVLFSRARREAVERYNEEVRQNREMLKNINAVLYLARQEMAFRGHDESSTSLNQGNYRELLKSFGKLDSVFDRRLHGRLQEAERCESGGVFTGVSSDVQNDVIECIDSVIEDQINKEVSECQFFSIQCDETMDVSTKEQLSIIIRLDRGYEIVERFLKFSNVSRDRTALEMGEVVKATLSKFGASVKSKLIMQTYDGAAVMSGQLSGLQTRIRQDYPFAFFFHCAAHRLNLVLCQSAQIIKQIKWVFSKVNSFCTFSSSCPDRKAFLTSKDINIPSPGETRWYYKSRAVSVIFKQFESLHEAFTEIQDNPVNFTDETVSSSDNLLSDLESFLFCFLLELYNKILEKSSILYAILQNRSTDFSYGAKKLREFVNFLTNDLRNDAAYESCYAAARRRVPVTQAVGVASRRAGQNINHKQLYFEVTDTIVAMMNNRFEDVESFSFLDLVNPKIFTKWQNGIPSEMLQHLREKYGSLFDMSSLENQLMFIYKDQDFLKENPMELLKYIFEMNTQGCIPEVVKLLKLNGVIAVSSAPAERSFSCLGRVKSYLRSKMNDDRLGCLCRISIHKDILHEKEDKKQLYELVLEKFVQKPRHLNFRY